MAVFKLLIVLNFVIYGICIKEQYDQEFQRQPKIAVSNGHLHITVPREKNIHFEASQVSINDMDLVTTLTKAKAATSALTTYQNSFSTYITKINDLESRLQVIEPDIRNGINYTGSNNTTNNLYWQNSIRRINRKLMNIQRGQIRLNTLLLTNECSSNPCRNGGTCTDMFNDFWCDCPSSWEGKTCENDVNECARFAGTDLGCQNGATCVNQIGTYKCLCPKGFVGLHCTRNAVDCNTGGTELCGHGTCIPQNTPNGYKCICDQGWTNDGTHLACDVDIDECKLNHPPCSINPRVPCINVPGSFYCGTCPQGYTGNGYYCSDIDECSILNGGCSMSPLVQCINTPGSKICGPCPPGYFGDGITCSYKGVCNINNGGCFPTAQCRDNPRISSTYIECICPFGMVGNGIGPDGCRPRSSSDNPCNPSPCVHGTCVVTNNSTDYVCNCNSKYTGRNCEVYQDPCSSNPCENGGTCMSVAGILFKCQCASGFYGSRCQLERESCGGTLRGENGTLIYPTKDFEEYSSNGFSCAWVIQTTPGKVLNVSFTKFSVGNSGICRNDWVQIHDGRNTASKLVGRFCGNQLPDNGIFTSTDNVMYLWFKSNKNTKTEIALNWKSKQSACGGLFTQKHGRIASPGSPGNYPNNRDCSWIFIASPGKRFLFHFYQLEIGNNSDCNHDYLKIYSGSTYFGDSGVITQYCNSSLPAPLYSTGSPVIVRFHSDNRDTYPGFQMTFSVVEGIPGCGGVYTTANGILQSPVTDGIYGGMRCDFEIKLKENAKVKITFLELNLPGGNGKGCGMDFLKIYEGSNTSAPLIGTYCGTNLPGPYMSLTNSLTLLSSLQSATSKWKLKYESLCSVRLTNRSGSINSNRESGVLTNCIYIIDQPAGYQITLTLKLNLLMTDANSSCTRQYIEVRDGDSESSPLFGRYCGTNTVSVQSSHNVLWMKVYKYFHSTFEADYNSINTGCGGILTKKIGTIAYPNDGSNTYPPGKTCRWMVRAPPGNVIQLTWMTFHLEQMCIYDNVKVFDNGTEAGGLMGEFCGYNLPPVLLSSSNIITLMFQSDSSINGEGFLVSYTFLKEENVCGGNYFTSAGVIKSPGYPNQYPMNRECKWTITVEPGRQILLNITDFDLEAYASCRYDWLEIRNGGTSASPLIGRYCGTNKPSKSIPSHTNKLYLQFNTDSSRSGKGFKITWTSTATGCGGILSSPTGSIISPHYPEPYSRSTDCFWKISVSAGSKVQAVFADIDLERHAFCGLDYVEMFDGLTSNSKSLGRYCAPGSGPIITSKNNMLVKFRSDITFQGRGFNLQYSTVCNNILRGFRGVIESPNFPNEYPQNQNCSWEIIVSRKNQINITFSHFQLERSVTLQNKSCAFDYVEIQYPETNENYGRYCGDDNPGLITLKTNHARIHFVSDSLLLGSGFRLEWQLFGCGGILTDQVGTIKSPNYPNTYPTDIQCQWLIQVDFGYSIEITFHELELEPGYDCSYDFIKVYNGIDSTYNQLAKFCHQTKPITITSSGNNMFIEFESDQSYQSNGFIANYSTVATKCGGRLTASSGAIFSPNYPKNYNRNDTCEWLIEVNENHVVNLQFEDVDLLVTSNCTQNYVKIFDGPSQAYPVLAKVCGSNTLNETIVSSYNQVYVEFRSHAYFTSKGFHLNYHQGCGARIKTQGNGIIELSRFYEFSNIDSNCSWTIEALNPSDHVALTITHMEGSMIDCDYTSEIDKPVHLYNGDTSESPVLGSYCGTKTPPTQFSDGSIMHIVVSTAMDFFATYSVLNSQCGGTLASQDGYFSTPGYPKTYPLNTKCEWTIAMAKGNRLNLNFINFNLPDSTYCNTDYLEIRKNNSSGELLGLYCASNGPQNISHTGSLWLLFKSSNLTVINSEATSKGFYAEYSLINSNDLTGPFGEIASPLYPRMYFGNRQYTWTVTVAPRKAILLTVKELHTESDTFDEDECYSTSISIFDGPDDTYEKIGSFCGVTIPAPLKSSLNIITIVFDNYPARIGTKFLLEWIEINKETKTTNTKPIVPGCGSLETIDMNANKKVNISSPEGAAGNIQCEWIFSTISMKHLRFKLIHMDGQALYHPVSVCTDYLEIFDKDDSGEWKSVQKYCKDDGDNKYIDLSSLAKVVFVRNNYRNTTQFSAEMSTVCGGSLTDHSGYIIFKNNTATRFQYQCQWNITVRPSKRIELIFEKMVISSDPNNCDNYIVVRNGKFPDSPFLGAGKFCGNQKPGKLISTGNNLYIKYSGYPAVEGFQIKYQEVGVQCGGDIRLESFDNATEISSPNYPNIPESHTECNWIIRAPPGELLQIDFEERFDLTYTKNCDKEYVEIRDGGTKFSPIIKRICESIPSTQFTTDNIMFVRFFTDVPEPKNGFKAKISIATCGGTVRGETGEIKTPESKIYPVNCTWRIVGPSYHYLNISFDQLQLSLNNNCSISKNYVSLSDKINVIGPNVSSDLGTYCKNTGDSLPTIQSLTNEVLVKLTIGSPVGYKGFNLKFNATQNECGGQVTQESGVITSPGFYPYHNNTAGDCRWAVTVPEGRRIIINFEEIDLDPYMRAQYLGIFNGDSYESRIVEILSNNIAKFKSQTYKSSSNKIVIYFWHPKTTTHKGFKLNFNSNEPSICVGDFNQTSGVISRPETSGGYVCEWQHKLQKTSQTLAVTLNIKTNFTFKGSICKHAFSSLTVKDIQNRFKIRLCHPTREPITIRSPYPISQLKAAIDGHFQLNFTASYSTHECGGIVNGEEGSISSPNFPNKPTKLTECAWLLEIPTEQRIKINFNNISLGSNCEKSFLSIYNGDSSSSPKIGTYCKNNIPENFTSQSNKLWIEYKYEPDSDSTGFKLTYKPLITGCGGVFHDKSRLIQTPNYGNDYPDNSECLWEIRSLPGYYIRLTFLDRFHIEESKGCINDYLEIWDWVDDKWVSLGKQCGREVTNNINSTSDRLKLLFRSNDKISGSGFKAKWDWHCGGTFETTSKPQYITSPGYPNTYKGNLNCIYKIKPKKSIVIVKFDDFELEDGTPKCKYDNVTIRRTLAPYESFRINSHINANVYCGNDVPQLIRNRGTLEIEFHTDKYLWANGRGFKFQYFHEDCGGEITNATEINYQWDADKLITVHHFIPFITCTWKVTAPSGKIVGLAIDSLKTGQMSNCYGQGLSIYNGLEQNMNKKLATFCGNINGISSVMSESNTMLIKMNVNPNNFKGFKGSVYFTYGPSSGCGGTINLTETKTIESPNNLADLDCAWKITAPRDYQVKIEFTSINVPGICDDKQKNPVFCSCAYIEVRDGGGPVSDIMSVLCSGIHTETLTTSWNNAYIRMFVLGTHNNVFKATLTPVKSPCGTSILTVNSTKQVLTSPNYPNSYPDNIQCTWRLNTPKYFDTLDIHFEDFDLADESLVTDINRCEQDRFEIIEDSNSQAVTEGLGPSAVYNTNPQRFIVSTQGSVYNRHAFCGKNDIPFDYYSRSNSLILSFKSVYSSLKRGKGFKLEYSLAGCNRNYTALQGRVVSGDRLSSNGCSINITVPESRTISLYFLKFYTMNSPDCNRMGLEIREKNSTGVQLLKACGYRLPDAVFSNTNSLWIHFYSQISLSIISRFDFVYTTSDVGRGCGGSFYNNQGKFTSPLYPNSYAKSYDCVWDIRVPTGLKTALKFTTFDIKGDCSKNNIVVETYSGNTATSHRFCANENPAVLFSSNKMKVSYHSSSENSGMGWVAYFQGISEDVGRGCGGSFYNNQGKFTSPLYPKSYAKSYDCVWDIRVPTGFKTALKFTTFDIKGDCSKNNIEVETYSGNTATSHRFCANENPAVLFSSNKMKVSYHSSSENSGMGWVAYFQGISEVTSSIVWPT